MLLLKCLLLLSIFASIDNSQDEKKLVRILGLFGPDEQEESYVFQKAIDEANNENLRRSGWKLEGKVSSVPAYDSFSLSNLICREFDQDEGLSAIFGPDYAELTSIVRSLTFTKKIPHIDTRWDTSYFNESEIYINLYPESALLAKAIRQVLDDMDWETFTLIYESAESLVNLQEVLKNKMSRSKYDRPTIIMRQLPARLEDYQTFLKQIKNSSETHIMLHCEPDKIMDVLRTAKKVDLLGQYQTFFITFLDAHTVDFASLQPIDSNITTLRLINPRSMQLNDRGISKWNKDKNVHLINITADTIKTDTALMRDAVMLFTQALLAMPSNFSTQTTPCSSNKEWEFGQSMVTNMKMSGFDGFSGSMNFDIDSGKRTYFQLQIVELLAHEGFRILGHWDPVRGVRHARNITQISEESRATIANKTLRAISKLVDPFLKMNDSLEGNDKYYGFCKDLLDMLAKELNFDYTLTVPEGAAASVGELNKETGRYSGLIGELRELRADIAVFDFTVTPDRKTAVDITSSFMSLGISILYTKPPPKETSYFSFLDPFDIGVWTHLATAYLTLSLTLYVIARCSPNEWEGAHPCNQDPEELENAWNLKNCLWLALGSVLQQGCDILPKSVSTRVTAGVWWFFTLIIISTYTANLTAFLTTQRMESRIKNVEDLANQDVVKYGCYGKGATALFFKTSNESLYQRMWAVMESQNPSVFTESNEIGVERVLNSRHKYAFFMESPSIDYQTKQHCELTQIGGLLDSKFYAIALPPGSIYRDALTRGILRLKEQNKLNELKNKWWINSKNESCVEEEDEDKDKLTLANVGGVFVLLFFGCVLAFFVSILEFLWNVRKVAVREKISLSEAFWLELKFAFKCGKTTKPVRHTPQSEAMQTPLSVSQIGFINKST